MNTLGHTAIEVSPLAMGCWAIAGDKIWGPQKEEEAIAAIHVALDCGINFFDTAEGYGAGYSEELVGKALAGVRQQAVIGTKVSPTHAGTREDLEKACEASLRRLGTDYIDLYHLHWPNRSVRVEDVLAGFMRLRDAGKIRCFAVSNFGKLDLGDLLEHGRCEVNQLPYSLLWRAIETDIVPVCLEHDVSITCYSPLMQGLLTGKFQTAEHVPEGRTRSRHFSGDRPLARHGETGCEELTFATIQAIAEIAAELGRPMGELALAWLMQQPGVGSVLVGARSPEQVRQNAKAMDTALSVEVVERLSAATDELNKTLGPNPDMWQSKSRYR